MTSSPVYASLPCVQLVHCLAREWCQVIAVETKRKKEKKRQGKSGNTRTVITTVNERDGEDWERPVLVHFQSISQILKPAADSL